MPPTIALKNHQNGELAEDELHKKISKCPFFANKKVEDTCTEGVCKSSVVFPSVKENTGHRTKDEVKEQAKTFLKEFISGQKGLQNPDEVVNKRWAEIEAEVDASGTYRLTDEELAYGVKLAWRNAPRCIGRIQWNRIQLFDCREVTTPSAMFKAICQHLEFATNKGNIKSAITVFRPRREGQPDFRVWNPQLIAFAGYKMEDDTIVGDPSNVEFTQVCEKLGWKSQPGRWNVLPMVLSAGGPPEVFPIPPELALVVPISHPTMPWMAELGLRWFALPAVSGMMLDCGGVEFSACPFNGWYMGTEIGCRNLSDEHRYNQLPLLAKRMGLSTQSPTQLWKDKALVELNIAVLHSFKVAGVTIVDHHTASEQFMTHYANEKRVRGGCPADWVWIVPPMSGSLTPVYHQEMAVYNLKPSYDYQRAPWVGYSWSGEELARVKPYSLVDIMVEVSLTTGSSGKQKTKLKAVAIVARFARRLIRMQNEKKTSVTILFATETGKSETYARKMTQVLGKVCNVKLSSMEDYELSELGKEKLLLVITSTFGNGDPPENGQKFANHLHALKEVSGNGEKDSIPTTKTAGRRRNNSKSFFRSNSTIRVSDPAALSAALNAFQNQNNNSDITILKGLSFAVFGLGSTAYPKFCAFANYVDNLLGDLGGLRLFELTKGDELAGQDQTFAEWSKVIQQKVTAIAPRRPVTVTRPNLNPPQNITILRNPSIPEGEVVESPMEEIPPGQGPVLIPSKRSDDFVTALAAMHPSRKVQAYKLMGRKELDPTGDTINIVLQSWSHAPLEYSAGDHVGIFPSNPPELVTGIIARLQGLPSPRDAPVQLRTGDVSSSSQRWPRCPLKELLARYLDVSTPPSSAILEHFMDSTNDVDEKRRLKKLVEDGEAYGRWRENYWPTVLIALQQFPNCKPDAATLCSLLPKIQPRFYSVSSTPRTRTDELHLTIGVIRFMTQKSDGLRHGLCSNHLNDEAVGTMLPCFVRSAPSFHLPEDKNVPLIMVGPGTGIAPFKGFCDEMAMGLKKGKQFGQWTLFHGCRTKAAALYNEELQNLARVSNNKFKLHIALSRDPKQKKTYVQDLIRAESRSVAVALMEQGAHFYVCGDVNMAEGVGAAVKYAIGQHYSIDEDKVENIMLTLRDEERYHEDIFGVLYKARVLGLPSTDNVQKDSPKLRRWFLSKLEAVTSGFSH